MAVLAHKARAPHDRTLSVHKPSVNLDRGPPIAGAAPSRRGCVKSRRSRSLSGVLYGYPIVFQEPRGILWEDKDEDGEVCVEEEEYEETEVAAALEGAPEASEAPNLALSSQRLVSQAERKFLKMMEQMAQFMGQLTQAVASRDNPRDPKFKTPSMKASDSFYGTQAHKLRGFIRSCQLIFHNDTENSFYDRNKAL
ncbi:hypothetical protein O181_052088 [Austropuccinia psidii MF-1]|uniref:Uncharacterized protein n=1 Tax=Austropuccinia psidii MF-1 TaxID=1389203 RepID=A0A9Q3E200_9BASI|nr:hypothetical protein [Austropuccinia psidii MF-1]